MLQLSWGGAQSERLPLCEDQKEKDGEKEKHTRRRQQPRESAYCTPSLLLSKFFEI